MHAFRDPDPRARFVHCEPLIAILHSHDTGLRRSEAEGWHQAQFQAFDLLSGRIWPQIGGDQSLRDIIGVNYCPNHQWLHAGVTIDLDHPAYRPLADLPFETHARYLRPIFGSKTGVENHHHAPWQRMTSRWRRRSPKSRQTCTPPAGHHALPQRVLPRATAGARDSHLPARQGPTCGTVARRGCCDGRTGITSGCRPQKRTVHPDAPPSIPHQKGKDR
jgi:hypothetical protein